MRAVAVTPAARRVEVRDVPEPRPQSPSDVVLKMIRAGVCGTDREICRFDYGTPPAGGDYLVIGHESLAEVAEAGPGARDWKRGDLAVLIVRRPCDDPACDACRAGRQDFCVTGNYVERGIKGAHGFMAETVVDDARWLVRVPVFVFVREPAPKRHHHGSSVGAALRESAALFAMPQTLGIVALAAVTYASFITLRGLWLGPLLIERYGFSLLQSGNVALAVSVTSLLGPPVFGRLDPMGAARRPRIVGFSLFIASAFAFLAFVHDPLTGVAATLVIGFMTGFIVWQYADVRAAYPEALTGRAMAVFTMAMFLGVALVQWLTGVVATLAHSAGIDPYTAVLLATALLVATGTLAFRLLPAPRTGR